MKLINNIKHNKQSYIILLLGIALWIDKLLWDNTGNVLFLNMRSIILMAYGTVTILSLIEGIIKWKIMNWKGLLPLILSILIILFIYSASVYINKRRFDHNFQDYNQIVEQIQSGKIIITPERTYIPKSESFPAYEITAYKLGDNKIMVKFEVFHRRDSFGYVYISQGKINEKLYSIKIIRQLRPNWYSYSD
jgi:hypothetical protein